MPEVKEPKIFYLRDASGAPVACVASKAAEHWLKTHPLRKPGEERG